MFVGNVSTADFLEFVFFPPHHLSDTFSFILSALDYVMWHLIQQSIILFIDNFSSQVPQLKATYFWLHILVRSIYAWWGRFITSRRGIIIPIITFNRPLCLFHRTLFSHNLKAEFNELVKGYDVLRVVFLNKLLESENGKLILILLWINFENI